CLCLITFSILTRFVGVHGYSSIVNPYGISISRERHNLVPAKNLLHAWFRYTVGIGMQYSMFRKHRCFFKNMDDKIIDGTVDDTSITSMFYVKNIERIQFCFEVKFFI